MRVTVPPDSELSLDLVNGARVQFEAGSSGWLLAAEPAAVVLSSGSLFAQLPPQGSAAGRPALRIVTSGYALSLAVSGELWLVRSAASSGGAVRAQYLAVLTGMAELEQLPAEPQARLASSQFVAGQAFGGSPPAAAFASGGPQTLEQARAAYARAHVGSKLESRAVPDPEASLNRALEAWSDAERRGHAILDAQRDAKSRGDSAAVQARQSELVALAQEKLAVRGRVRLAYELACERAVGRLGDANSELARFEATYVARVAPALPPGM
jgi:hypothetical protein